MVVYERSGYVSYANCGLPYYIGGVITDPAELTLQTPESFWQRFRIEMKVRHEVQSIDTAKKTVTVKNLNTGEVFQDQYDALLLSPGAKPTQPELPGVDLPELFTLRTVEDTLKIHAFLQEKRPRSAVLAGGGFIGLELAENLREQGLEVTIVQRPRHVLGPIDEDMAAFLHAELRRHGVRLQLGSTVEGFRAAREGGVEVLLKGEPSLQADMVVLAIGVTPDTRLAREAGLELGLKGQHCGQRPDGDLGSGCVRRGRRGAGEAFCHRGGRPHRPGWSGQQTGAHRRRQHLRRGTAGIRAPRAARC